MGKQCPLTYILYLLSPVRQITVLVGNVKKGEKSFLLFKFSQMERAAMLNNGQKVGGEFRLLVCADTGARTPLGVRQY